MLCWSTTAEQTETGSYWYGICKPEESSVTLRDHSTMRILRWAAAIAFVASSRVLSQGREIARTTADLNRDGRPDVISIRSLSPRSVNDRQPWCGAGRKDTGRVDISVTLSGGMYRKTNLNSLLHEPSLSFSAKS